MLDDEAETVAATEPSPESALAFDLEETATGGEDTLDAVIAHDHGSIALDSSEPDAEFAEAELDESDLIDFADAASDSIEPPAIGSFPSAPLDSEEPTTADPISDSAFGREVVELAGDSGTIVEAETPTIDDLVADAERGPVLSPQHVADSELSFDSEVDPTIDLAPDILEPATTTPMDLGVDQHATIAPSTEINADIDLFEGSHSSTAPVDDLDDLSAFLSDESINDLQTTDPDIKQAIVEELAEAPHSPDVVEPVAETPAAPETPRSAGHATPEERGQFWGNEATVLGGQPLALPAGAKSIIALRRRQARSAVAR